MKKISAILLALVMVCASFTAVFAGDYEYDLVFITEPDNGCEKVLRKEVYNNGAIHFAETFEYSEDGFCTSSSTYRPDENGELHLDDTTLYEYDSEGRMIKWEYWVPFTDSPVPELNDTVRLAQSGKLTYDGSWVEEEKTIYEDSGAKVVSRTREEYNEYGERISSVEYTLNDAEQMYISYESTITEENNTITSIAQSFGQYPYYYKYITEYTDDRNCPLREYVYSSEDGTDPQLSDYYEYEYDDQKRTIREHSVHYEDGSDWISTTVYETGENGEQIETIKTTDAQGNYVNEASYITYTDEFGNMTREMILERDSETAEWTIGLDETYEYDTNGTLISDIMKMDMLGETDLSEFRYVSELRHRKLQKTDQQAAGIGKAGVKEYYYCDECEHYYSDPEGQKPIADIEAWKTGEGAIEAKSALPIVVAAAAVIVIAAAAIIISKKKKQQ